MGFNYGLEKKNFDRQWAIMRKQYEDAGMSIEVIQAMYEYDWSVFNAARSYQNHTQEIAAPSFEQGEEAYSPLMNKYQEAISITEHYRETKSRFTWIGEIEDERLLSALENPSVGCCPAIFIASDGLLPKRSRFYVCPLFVAAPSGEISVASPNFRLLTFYRKFGGYT